MRRPPPSLHRSLLHLLFVMGVLLWVSSPAIARPPLCENGGCDSSLCGDGTCSGNETCSTCPDDCGSCQSAVCGDGICQSGESCSNCSTDCGGCPAGDGHVWCDGWDSQGDCAFNHLGVAGASEFRRLRGSGGYIGQTFLTWNSAEFNGFGRFQVPDGNVGLISTSPIAGQVPLYRWSTRKGFYYSTYYGNYGGDYVYGGIAGYVWPAGSNLGFPLYQFYSQQYGHYYTNYPHDIYCQPNSQWAVQGEMARVNWPAPFFQANQVCYSNQTLGPFPPTCDPFFAERCRAWGGFFNFTSCTCF